MKVMKYLKALGDETRFRLFNLLSQFELSVNEMVEVLAMGQSRISRHLKILSDSGLLSSRRDGLWVYYSAQKNEAISQLSSLLKLDRNEVLERDTENARRHLRERDIQSKVFFDSIAGSWDRLKNELLGSLNVTEHILRHIPGCSTAADLGCGTGELLVPLRTKAARVIGVDHSPKMLELARRRLAGNGHGIELRLGELEHLPLRDKEAECAVISMALHHLAHPVAGIQEAHRILNKGDHLIIVDFDKHTNETLREEYGDRWLGFKPDEIISAFQKSGFLKIKQERLPLNTELAIQIFVAQKTSLAR